MAPFGEQAEGAVVPGLVNIAGSLFWISFFLSPSDWRDFAICAVKVSSETGWPV